MEPCVPKFIEDRDRRRDFIATPSPPLLLVILARNRREEERPAPVAQRRYNNRKKTNQLETPKPLHNLRREQVTRLVCVCICVHQFHSWVTDGALSLAGIGRAAHIPRHAGNAFCDVRLMLTSHRITHQITVVACSLLCALSVSKSTHRAHWGVIC